MIPICDLKQQYASLRDELNEAMQRVAADAQFILGPNVRELEREIAEYCRCECAVGVNSGTDALHLALRGLNIGPGDEVITTPFTFVATTEAIGMVGATPVFVDVDPLTFNMDVTQIESRITLRTKAILPVHLYGQPCNMDVIMDVAGRHGLAVIEDCAQAIGATWRGRPVGSIGDVGCLSFFPSKNLGCFGDGGMLVTNRVDVYERVEMLRRHGGRVKYQHEELGLNSRLDEMQAAILRVKLPHLKSWISARRALAHRYNEKLRDFPGVILPSELCSSGSVIPTAANADENDLVRSVYHQFTILVQDRDDIQKALQEAGIGCMVYYPIPLHLQKVHADLGFQRGSFPYAEEVSSRCISIPMFPELAAEDQDVVIAAIKQIVSSHIRPLKLRYSA